MSAQFRRGALLLFGCLFLGAAARANAQEEHEHRGARVRIGGQAIGLFTHMTPATLGEDLSEGYVTQPMLMGHAAFFGGAAELRATIDLEGWTLERGELNPSIWGEGFVDRRHPHTYLHELIGTAGHDFGRWAVSVSAGKGFAPFGTDDPMVRGFAKYPANHHFAQILERLVALGAVRFGPASLEAGVFNGDEPLSPRSNGTLDRFADSWSVRATVAPITGLELQASHAEVESPEVLHGGGLDHHKLSASARFERDVAGTQVYGLGEFAQTRYIDQGIEKFSFSSVLVESMVRRSGYGIGFRYERTIRPEEERLLDPFHSARPPTDFSILGRTRWNSLTLQLSRELPYRYGALTPLLEVTRSHAAVVNTPAPYEPADFYGDDDLWTLSLGIRVSAGAQHIRMGRYGVATQSNVTHH